jgi:hypothetical protein
MMGNILFATPVIVPTSPLLLPRVVMATLPMPSKVSVVTLTNSLPNESKDGVEVKALKLDGDCNLCVKLDLDVLRSGRLYITCYLIDKLIYSMYNLQWNYESIT